MIKGYEHLFPNEIMLKDKFDNAIGRLIRKK